MLMYWTFSKDQALTMRLKQALEKVGLKWSMLATTSWDAMFETLEAYVEDKVSLRVSHSFAGLFRVDSQLCYADEKWYKLGWQRSCKLSNG
jgi:hypothetical protein